METVRLTGCDSERGGKRDCHRPNRVASCFEDARRRADTPATLGTQTGGKTMTTIEQAIGRIDYKQIAPAAFRAQLGVETYVRASGLEQA